MGAMQRYVSKELTHFVGKDLRKEIMDKNQRREEQYNILLKIIKEKCISYHPHFPDEPPTTRRTRIVYPGNFSNNIMIDPSVASILK